MRIDPESAGRLPSQSRYQRLRDRVRGSLHHSLRRRAHYSRHAREVARGHRQFAVLIDALNPPKDGLSNPANRLTPAEVFLDSLADHLTDSVSVVPGRSPINAAAAPPSIVLRHVASPCAAGRPR
jgi:hypothetical protein